jgi:hypothetical protein
VTVTEGSADEASGRLYPASCPVYRRQTNPTDR